MPRPKKDPRLEKLAPRDELQIIMREALASVEADLALEDAGWINLSATMPDVITPAERIVNLKLSRLYSAKDPLGKQSIRLWTDYTFGGGMTWNAEDKTAEEVLKKFWNNPANKVILSAKGQRISSDKVLIDGEIFFALFLGAKGDVKIRRIDPLEITEIITDPDDKETAMFYRRQWVDTKGGAHDDYYRSVGNVANKPAPSPQGNVNVHKTQNALIYHFAENTISQRGNPLLLPALLWMKYYNRFLSSRIAIMLALARFAWKSKVKGGQPAVDAVKAITDQQQIAAGSHLLENMGVETTPIKSDSGALKAYQDGRMVKLQVAAAVGIPEQYYGDISIGNLATAKTVELPMMKMFQSYQKRWDDTYQDIDEIVLAHSKVDPSKWYVDRDFPAIAPSDVAQTAEALSKLIGVLPDLVDSEDVLQVALMTLGIDDTTQVIEDMKKAAESDPSIALNRSLRRFRESLERKGTK